MERHTVSRLVGAPPGYVGYEEGGQLTEAVRRKSYSVILLDEIEKAHPEAFNMLLQIMEDGKLADAKGRKVDFRNTIIIMTSNVGADQITRDMTFGFQTASSRRRRPQQRLQPDEGRVMGELKQTFRPEFLNRIDGIDRLPPADEGGDPRDRRSGAQARPHAARGAGDHAGNHRRGDGSARRARLRPQYGARPLRRIIQNLIEDPLAEGLLAAAPAGHRSRWMSKTTAAHRPAESSRPSRSTHSTRNQTGTRRRPRFACHTDARATVGAYRQTPGARRRALDDTPWGTAMRHADTAPAGAGRMSIRLRSDALGGNRALHLHD